MRYLKLLLISNALQPPYDEGIRKFASSIEKALTTLDVETKVINACGIIGKTFASPSLWKEIKIFQPQVIIYLPTASITAASFMKISLLRTLAPSAVTVLIALQPRSLSNLAKRLIPFLAPHCLLVQNPNLLVLFRNLSINVDIIYSGVDSLLFTPVLSEVEKLRLRVKYGLPDDKRIILHVGHISPYRNLNWITSLRRLGCVPVIVGSTSTARVSRRSTLGNQNMIIEDLRKCRIVILNRYIESIWEIYQMADVYVFPVISEEGSIGIPLSVLEAMACNLPVVTTPFGGLPTMFSEGDGLFFVKEEEGFLQHVQQALSLRPDQVKTREKVLPYSWENIASMILKKTEELCKAT